MTQDNTTDIASIYEEMNKAELQASTLEKMLDNLESKMNSILKEAEEVKNMGSPKDETNDNISTEI